MHTPDLFDRRTFDTIEEGMAFAREAGFGALADVGWPRPRQSALSRLRGLLLRGHGRPAARADPPRRRRRPAHVRVPPISEFGDAWPEGVPAQVHGKDADPFFTEDLEAAHALVDSTVQAELFLYPGEEHLFADSSLAGIRRRRGGIAH